MFYCVRSSRSKLVFLFLFLRMRTLVFIYIENACDTKMDCSKQDIEEFLNESLEFESDTTELYNSNADPE